MILTLGNLCISARKAANPSDVICMQTGMPASPANVHAGKLRGSSNQVACPGMVLPVVNRRIPPKPRLHQWRIFSTASSASTSTENTPVKRPGYAAIASAT
jgi:hypothetical protein